MAVCLNVRGMVTEGVKAIIGAAMENHGWFRHGGAGAVMAVVRPIDHKAKEELGSNSAYDELCVVACQSILPGKPMSYTGDDGMPVDCTGVAFGKITACLFAKGQNLPLCSGESDVRERCDASKGLQHWRGAVGLRVILQGKPFCDIVYAVSGANEDQDRDCAAAGLERVRQELKQVFPTTVEVEE